MARRVTWEPKPLLWSEHRVRGSRWLVWLSCPELSPSVPWTVNDAGVCVYKWKEIYVLVREEPRVYPEIWIHEIGHAVLEKTPTIMLAEERVLRGLDHQIIPILRACGLRVPPLPEGWQRLRRWSLRRYRAEYGDDRET